MADNNTVDPCTDTLLFEAAYEVPRAEYADTFSQEEWDEDYIWCAEDVDRHSESLWYEYEVAREWLEVYAEELNRWA